MTTFYADLTLISHLLFWSFAWVLFSAIILRFKSLEKYPEYFHPRMAPKQLPRQLLRSSLFLI